MSMMTMDDVEALFQEIGPLDDGIEAVVREAEECWIVRFAEVDVLAEFDPETQRLRLGTEIGVPEPDRMFSVYEALLVYNSAGRQSGDVVMALSGAGGSVMQLVYLEAASLTARLLIVPIVNLADRAVVWRALMVSGMASEAADDSAFLPTDFMIRA